MQQITEREVMLSGPSETGKTWATLWRLDTLLRTTPGAQAALVRKVRKTIAPTVLVTYKRVLERSSSGAVAYGGNNPEWYDYPNGARLWIGGMDDPSKILSGERDFVYVNQAEELTQDDWETLTTRVTGRGAVTKTPMLFGDCNPGPEDHWILRRPTLRRLDSKHEDNPALFGEDGQLTEQGQRTMATLDALTGVRKQRLRYGRWVGAEGQFFETWDEALHTCEPFPVPGDWLVWAALDHGFVHPTAYGLFTQDNDGRMYMIGEHVQHKWLVPQHADAIKSLQRRCGVWQRVRMTAAGHDVFAQRADSQGQTIADQYAAGDVQLSRATLDRINGAAEIMTRLGNTQADVSPSLFIWNTCVRTIATIPRMVHDPRRPEDVLKADADLDGQGGDDCYDMLRYGVMEACTSVSAPRLPKQPNRWGGLR